MVRHPSLVEEDPLRCQRQARGYSYLAAFPSTYSVANVRSHLASRTGTGTGDNPRSSSGIA